MSRQIETCNDCGKIKSIQDTAFGCESDLELQERLATICQCEVLI